MNYIITGHTNVHPDNHLETVRTDDVTSALRWFKDFSRKHASSMLERWNGDKHIATEYGGLSHRPMEDGPDIYVDIPHRSERG